MVKNIEFKLKDFIPFRGARTFGERNPNVFSTENLQDYWAMDKFKVFGFLTYQIVASALPVGYGMVKLFQYFSSVIDKV